MQRRDALRTMAAWSAAAAVGGLPAGAAATRSRSRIGLVIYTQNLRQAALLARDRQDNLFEPLRFLEHCHELGAGGIQVPLGVRDAAEMRRLRERAEQLGMFVEGIANPPRDEADAERFEAEIRAAAAAGALAVRTVILPGRRYEFFDSLDQFNEFLARARRSLELAAPVVQRHRVPLAVENHKDQRVDERVELLRTIGCEYVGACVDIGNNLALLEDPVEVVEKLAPWALSVHLKDHAVQEHEDGFLLSDVPLGAGCLDLKKMADMLLAAKPQVRFSIELITRDALKVPCLTDKYWATFPDLPGRDLARTLRWVRQHRSDSLPQVSSLSADEQVALETRHVLDSLKKGDILLFRDALGGTEK